MYWMGHVNWTFGRPATVSSERVYVWVQIPGPTIVVADSVVGVVVQSGVAKAMFGSEYTESCAWLRLSPTVNSWSAIACGLPTYQVVASWVTYRVTRSKAGTLMSPLGSVATSSEPSVQKSFFPSTRRVWVTFESLDEVSACHVPLGFPPWRRYVAME